MTAGVYEQTTPTIKMLIGSWYLDEFGNPTREIRARDERDIPSVSAER
jgi:hypothetical protein